MKTVCMILFHVGIAASWARYSLMASQSSSRRSRSTSMSRVRSQAWRFQAKPTSQKSMTTGRARYDWKKPAASLKPPLGGQMAT